jgi:hypothetical protein
MRYTVFDMNSSLNGERPKPIREVGVNEEGPCHGGKGEVAAFCNAILIGCVWDGFFVSDALGFAEVGESAFSKLGGVIDTKNSDFLLAEIFNYGAKLDETLSGVFARLHEIEGNVSRVTTNK